MEQKKTLWIIAAVAVFLLVVFGGAMIFYNPSALSSGRPASINPVEKRSNSSTPVTTETIQASSPQVNDMFVVSENTTVLGFTPQDTNQSTTIDLNALKRELASDLASQQTQPQNINITVNMPEQEKEVTVVQQPPVVITSEYITGNAKEAEKIEKETSVKKTEPATSTVTKETKSTDTAAKTVSKPVASTPAKTTPTTTTASKTTTVSNAAVTRYWVQVAAYGNKKTAENARSVLSDKKINSDIYTYEDAKGKLFYRVRVGPFTTKSEAEYWKSKIVEISDFKSAGSYVTSTTN